MKARILACALVAACLPVAPAVAAPASRELALDRGRDALATHVAAVRGGPGQAFRVRDVVRDADGATHVRYARTYEGLDVLGGDVVVHSATDGAFRGASLGLPAAPSLSATPTVARPRGAELVVEARVGPPRLAWLTHAGGTQPDGTPSLVERTTDARTGEVLVSEEQHQTVTGSGQGLYVGLTAPVPLETTQDADGTFTLVDATRGGSRIEDARNRTDRCGIFGCGYAETVPFVDADNAWGSRGPFSRQTAAVDVAYGSAKTWDYFQQAFGRAGIRGDGAGALSRVHYGRRYDNAFWDDPCFCMTYGDGDGETTRPLVALDVTGHEMSHGVTSRTAGLEYFGESGGLNEATSDIFGTMVEFFANDPDDTPDFDIGEEFSRDGTPLRSMAQPSRDGASADCWTVFTRLRDVHFSSGVGNHFFYLLSQGSGTGPYDTSDTCGDAPPVTGIGNDAAQQIWYRALTVYMTSTTDYAGAREATLAAARDLYGAGSAQEAAVAAAWTAVNVA